MDFARWKRTTTALGPQVPADAAELDKALPVHIPDFGETIPTGKARITWLGHASVLLEVPVDENGTTATILTDREFWIGPKRYRPTPLQVADLPRIDDVVLSHNHYDHMESTTLTQLHERFPALCWFVPLDNAHYLTPLGVGGSFFFSGNTAYCSSFKAIGHTFGGFSVSAIPIGAYGRARSSAFSIAMCPRPFRSTRTSRPGRRWVFTGVRGSWRNLEPKMELERLMACEMECLHDSFYTLDH
ncbi:hypothetical protein SPRG_18230, partial [Saprolegnia parasitica CBS 223.65]